MLVFVCGCVCTAATRDARSQLIKETAPPVCPWLATAVCLNSAGEGVPPRGKQRPAQSSSLSERRIDAVQHKVSMPKLQKRPGTSPHVSREQQASTASSLDPHCRLIKAGASAESWPDLQCDGSTTLRHTFEGSVAPPCRQRLVNLILQHSVPVPTIRNTMVDIAINCVD